MKAQVDKMELELQKWRSGEKVDTEDQVIVEMEKSAVLDGNI